MKACPKIWPLPEIDRAVTSAVIGYCKVGHSQEIATRPVWRVFFFLNPFLPVKILLENALQKQSAKIKDINKMLDVSLIHFAMHR